MVLVDKEGSELSGVEMIRREDGSGHWVARVRLDEGNPLTDSIFGSLRLETRSPNYSFDPSEVELRLPRLEGEIRGTALVAGAGGLEVGQSTHSAGAWLTLGPTARDSGC